MDHPIFVLLGKIFGSTFLVSCIGALAGAAAGALGAQRVIERTKRRDELLKEIRNTNAAIMVAFTIANTMLGLKRQLVKPMQDKFQADLAAYRKYRDQRRAGEPQSNGPLELQAELRNFLPPTVPIETLKTLVYERISAFGRPLSVVSLVEGAADGLAHSLNERRRAIADLQTSVLHGEDFIYRYLGERSPSGQIHREYAELVDVIADYNDDLIFFSVALTTELAKHGQVVRSQFIKSYGSSVPNVVAPDFSKVKASGLFPPEENYSSWMKWIVELPEDAPAGGVSPPP